MTDASPMDPIPVEDQSLLAQPHGDGVQGILGLGVKTVTQGLAVDGDQLVALLGAHGVDPVDEALGHFLRLQGPDDAGDGVIHGNARLEAAERAQPGELLMADEAGQRFWELHASRLWRDLSNQERRET